jgi:hypothetical protein
MAYIIVLLLLRFWVIAQQASRAPRRAPPQGPSLEPTPVQIPVQRTIPLERHIAQLSTAIQTATATS